MCMDATDRFELREEQIDMILSASDEDLDEGREVAVEQGLSSSDYDALLDWFGRGPEPARYFRGED